MRVYLKPPKTESRSLQRVVKALIQYKPDKVEICESIDDSDIIILHIVGRQDSIKRQIAGLKKPYAVIQYCLRSTQRPLTENWAPIWKRAKVVWSYLDLEKSCIEDRVQETFNFYHAPLGCDSNVFYPAHQSKNYLIGTSSLSYLTESVKEIVIAAQRIKKQVFFLGAELSQPNVTCLNNISDAVLASRLSQCQFVSGLRRTEGFELPALEGLLCGARPIFFDRSHYKKWFSDWGVFIPEGPREKVIESLIPIFRDKVDPTVTQNEIQQVKKRFDWKPIINGFWEKCLQ